MTQPGEPTAPHRLLSPENQKLLVAGLVVLVAVFALVFSNVAANHAPKPHRLPVAVVGPAAVVGTVSGELERQAPGAFDIRGYDSLPAAQTAIRHRAVYGAFQPSPPVLLVASASSPPVAALLQTTFARVAGPVGQPLVVQNLVPLPPSDSSGATTFSAVLSLILVGLAGTSIIYIVTRQRPEGVRVLGTVVLGVAAGFLTAFVTNVVVGAFGGNFFAVWGIATMFVLAIGLPIAAFQLLFGIPGTAIGFVLFLVIGNPASGGSSAPELLPGFWRVLNSVLPTGAAVTALRDFEYFNGHGATRSLLVLAIYAVGGAVIAMGVYWIGVGRKPQAQGD